MPPTPLVSDSPSFTTYSSENLADIAARVVEEFRQESESDFDGIFGFGGDYASDTNYVETRTEEEEEETKSPGEDGDDDEEFEFPSLIPDPTSPISADDVFYNGQIRPAYPVFDRELLYAHLGKCEAEAVSAKPAALAPAPSPVRAPLRKLFEEERDPASCSSSEADELDGVAAGTYCVWKPKSAPSVAEDSPARCAKSNSTGTSKRWRFRSLIHRSNSDGKDTFVYLAPSGPNSKKDEKPTSAEKISADGKVKTKLVGDAPPAKDGDRRRSFLPYRKDLVGLFANMNGVSRNLQPF